MRRLNKVKISIHSLWRFSSSHSSALLCHMMLQEMVLEITPASHVRKLRATVRREYSVKGLDI